VTTPDPLVYVAARRVLLDALDALTKHRRAVVLVGAQAIYLQAGEADLEVSVAPFTADADLSIDPALLGPEPQIAEAMTSAGFTLKMKAGNGGVEPGTWLAATKIDEATVYVPVDLLVPEALAPGRGKRDARLPDHGKSVTRWTPGLEATVVDNTEMAISSLEPALDTRQAMIKVAGPAALLVAKSHKIADRLDDGDRGREHRVKPKDCADVIRIMRAPMPPAAVGARLAELARNPVCAASVKAGVEHLAVQFGGPSSAGVDLAVEALAGALPEELLRGLAPSYIAALLAAYQGWSRRTV